MKRRLNFTGRTKIDSDQIEIRITEPNALGQPATFSAQFNLDEEIKQNKNARVYVEPYVRHSSMRFSYGTAADPKAPSDTSLSELDSATGILFRIKVVDESQDVGKIIAAAYHVRPTDPSAGRRPLLPLVSVDLGEDIWRIDANGGADPVLQINNRVPGLRDRLLQDPILQGAIFPHALRAVMQAILGSGEYDSDMPVYQAWTEFVTELVGHQLNDDFNDAADLELALDEIVEKFCGVKQFATSAKVVEEEGQDA